MKKHTVTAVFAALLIAIMALCGCSTKPPAIKSDLPPETQTLATGVSTESTIRLIATRNFGQELMFDKVLDILPGTSAMAALKEVAEVETCYSGGFVSAIDDVHSGFTGAEKTKADWFIYFNGIQSNTGAFDYTLQPGDVEHWDFHDWGFRQFIPATIGDFPEPFLHGYSGKKRPTLIVYSNNQRELAKKLQNHLTRLGINDVSLRSADELLASDKEVSNLVVLGMADSKLISELNRNWMKLGFFAYFEDGNLIVLNCKGETAAKYGAGAGLIQATQNPWNPNGIGACENVAWMVTGTDESGVLDAVEALLKHHARLQYAFAVVIASGEIKKIPQ